MSDVTLTWTNITDPLSGTKGYYLKADHVSDTKPTSSDTFDAGTPYTFSDLADGDDWYCHIVAVDNADNLSTNADHFGPIKIDTTAPTTPGVPTFSELTVNAMLVTSATSTDDGSGLHSTEPYQFDCTDPGSPDRGWGVQTYLASGLSENTQYIFRTQAQDALGTPSSPGSTAGKYTLAAPPEDGELYLQAIAWNQMSMSVAPPPNSASGSTGARFTCQSGIDRGGSDSTMQVGDYNYTDSGLNPNQNYSWKVRYQNAEGTDSDYNTTEQLKYTLAQPGSNADDGNTVWITCDHSFSAWTNNSTFIFTNNDDFGAPDYPVEYFKYVWDTNPSTDPSAGTVWDTGNLNRTADADSNSWYLHLKSYNFEDAGQSTLYHMGPFYYDEAAPVYSAGTTAWTENTSYLHAEGDTLYFSVLMGGTGQQATVSTDEVSDAHSGVDFVTFSEWGDNAASDDSGSSPWEAIYTVDNSNEDTATLNISATDDAGNTGSNLVQFYTRKDTAGPTDVGCLAPPDGSLGINAETPWLKAIASSDALAGVGSDAYYIEVDQSVTFNSETLIQSDWGDWATQSWNPVPGEADLETGAIYYWRVKARDNVGNESSFCGETDTTGYFWFRTSFAPVASVNDITNESDPICAGALSEATMKFSDPDGYANLKYLYLGISRGGTTVFTLRATQGEAGSGDCWVPTGDSVFNNQSAPTYIKQEGVPTGDDITVTYYFTVDWSYQTEAGDYHYRVSCQDDTGDTDPPSDKSDDVTWLRTLSARDISFDGTKNPDPDTFSVSGYLGYWDQFQSVTVSAVPRNAETIADIRVNPDWTATDYDDDTLGSDGAFSISGITCPASLGTDYFDLEVIDPPDWGAQTHILENNEMDIDRVEVYAVIADYAKHQDDDGRYWDDWNDSYDWIRIRIAARLEDAGTALGAGDLVEFGYAGNTNVYGNAAAFSDFTSENQVEEDPADGTIIRRDDVTCDADGATQGAVNTYGGKVNVTASPLPDIGWDYQDPTDVAITNVVTSGDNVYYYATTGTLYYSNDQSMADTFTVWVTATDGLGVGLEYGHGETGFGDTPHDDSYSSRYELQYTINQSENETSPLTMLAVDWCHNTGTADLTIELDNTGPDITGITSNSTRVADGDTVQNTSGTAYVQVTVAETGAGAESGDLWVHYVSNGNISSSSISMNRTGASSPWTYTSGSSIPVQNATEDQWITFWVTGTDNVDNVLTSSLSGPSYLSASRGQFFIEFVQDGDVVFNEICWAGHAGYTADEWIELYNNTDIAVSLSGWKIYEGGGSTQIEELSGSIPAKGYYLIERDDDNTVSNIAADQTGGWGGSGLLNTGEHLVLKDSDGNTVDDIDCSGGWFKGITYKTMEKKNPRISGDDTDNWAIATVQNVGQDAGSNWIWGTPKTQNTAFIALDETAPAFNDSSFAGYRRTGSLGPVGYIATDQWSDMFNPHARVYVQDSGIGLTVIGLNNYATTTTVGFWRLNEKSGNAGDSSGYGFTGTSHNITYTASGYFNRCFEFTGADSCVSVGHQSELGGMSALTVEAWIKPDTTSGTRCIAQKENAYNFRLNNGTLEGYIYDTADSTWDRTVYKAVNIPTDEWTQVAFTWSNSLSGYGDLYVNGDEVGTNDDGVTTVVNTASSYFSIGARYNGGAFTEDFDGKIDEVMISNAEKTDFKSPYSLAPYRYRTADDDSDAWGGYAGHRGIYDTFSESSEINNYTAYGETWSVSGGCLRDDTGENFNTMALHNNSLSSDVYLEARARTTDDDYVGVIFRYSDSSYYYGFAIRPETNICRLWANDINPDAASIKWDYYEKQFDANEWYYFKVIAIQNRIRCYIDDDLVFDVLDANSTSGKAGLFSGFNQPYAEFDWFKVNNVYLGRINDTDGGSDDVYDGTTAEVQFRNWWIRFNQASADGNRVAFHAADLNGNETWSPAYTIKLDPTDPSDWTGFSSALGGGTTWIEESEVNNDATPDVRVWVKDLETGLLKDPWSAQADEDTVGRWRFDASVGTGASELSSNNYWASLINMTANGSNNCWVAQGQNTNSFSSQCVELNKASDNNDYIQPNYTEGTDSLFDFTTDFTLEIWFKAHTTSGDRMLISRRDSYNLWIDDGSLRFEIYDGEWRNCATAFSDTSSWHYAAATYDGSTMKLYLDGNLRNTYDISTTVSTNDYYPRFGNYEVTSRPFDGYIQEIRISDITRAEEEIVTSYHGAAFSYSTDAGSSWTSWTGATPNWSDGQTDLDYLTAYDVPFSNNSLTDNQVKFAVMDVTGNYATSGVHTVKIFEPDPGEIVISEVYYDPYDEDNGEFIELYNRQTDPVYLTGWQVEESTGGNRTITGLKEIPGHGYFLIGKSGWSTSTDRVNYIENAPAADIELGLLLSNTGEGVKLKSVQGTVIDTVGWETAPAGWFETEADSGAGNGQSISRDWSNADTDHNNNDFSPGVPSPQNSSSYGGKGSIGVAFTNDTCKIGVQDTFTVTYTADNDFSMSGGRLQITMPGIWPAPNQSAGTDGYVNISGGTATASINSISGQTVTINLTACTGGQTVEMEYLATPFGNSGTNTFTGKTRSSIGSYASTQDASVTVYHPDVKINEIYGMGGQGTREWIELYNADSDTINLRYWKLADDPGYFWDNSWGIDFPPETYLVIYSTSAGTAYGWSHDTDFSDGAGFLVGLWAGDKVGNDDDAGLYSYNRSAAAMADYVTWDENTPSGTNYDFAVADGQWTSGTYVDDTGTKLNVGIGRAVDGVDTDYPNDWDVLGTSPGETNALDILGLNCYTDISFGTSISEDVWQNDGEVYFKWTKISSDPTATYYYGYWTGDTDIVEYDASENAIITYDGFNSTYYQVQSLADCVDGYYFHVRPRSTRGNWGTEYEFMIRYDGSAPNSPSLSSSTHTEDAWSTTTDLTVEWTDVTDNLAGAGLTNSGVFGYYYRIDQIASTTPGTSDSYLGTGQELITFADLGDGAWYVHIAALDNAGNSSAVEHFGPVKIDVPATAGKYLRVNYLQYVPEYKSSIHGSCMFYELPNDGKNLLIDGGGGHAATSSWPSTWGSRPPLKTFLDDTIGSTGTVYYMVLNTPGSDSAVGLIEVLKRDYDVDNYYETGYWSNHSGAFYDTLYSELNSKPGLDIYYFTASLNEHTSGLQLSPPAGVDVGPGWDADIDARLITAWNRDGKDYANDRSSMIRTAVGRSSFLCGGDATGSHASGSDGTDTPSSSYYPEYYARTHYPDDLNVDIFAVNHQGSGSYGSNGIEFIKRVSPRFGIIQIGYKSTGPNPGGVVMNRLNDAGSIIYRNDLDGTVMVKSDNRGNYDITRTRAYVDEDDTPGAVPLSDLINPPPGLPTELYIDNTAAASITLSWADAFGETPADISYDIYRAITSGGWGGAGTDANPRVAETGIYKKIGSTEAGMTTFTDSGLVGSFSSQRFHYRVVAKKTYTDAGNSVTYERRYTNETIATAGEARDEISPEKVLNLYLGEGENIGDFEFAYTAPHENATAGGRCMYYVIKHKTSTFTSWTDAGLSIYPQSWYPKSPGSSENFNLEDFTEDTTYYFSVKAYDEYGNSGPMSDIVSGKPRPLKAGDVVINEIAWMGIKDYDPPGGDGYSGPYHEYIELFNTTEKPINMAGWGMNWYDQSDVTVYFTVASIGSFGTLNNTVIYGEDYFLIEHNDYSTNSFGDIDQNKLRLEDSPGRDLYLYADDARNYLAIDVVSGGSGWYAGTNVNDRNTMEKIVPYGESNDPANWADYSENSTLGDYYNVNRTDTYYWIYGTPGAENSVFIDREKDTDGDGMWDVYEKKQWTENPDDRLDYDDPEYNDSTGPIYNQGPMDDPDGDGFTNLQEFWLRTNPFDANDLLRLQSIGIGPNNRPRLTWRAWDRVNFNLDYFIDGYLQPLFDILYVDWTVADQAAREFPNDDWFNQTGTWQVLFSGVYASWDSATTTWEDSAVAGLSEGDIRFYRVSLRNMHLEGSFTNYTTVKQPGADDSGEDRRVSVVTPQIMLIQKHLMDDADGEMLGMPGAAISGGD